MQIYTSYFYQIRNFKSNFIPVSTCLSDPKWYKPPEGKEYYIDKRGVICGLRYEPLIVQPSWGCPCPAASEGDPYCSFLFKYERNLYNLDKNKILSAFEFCGNKFKKELKFEGEPIIVLIVYEAPNNPCSERYALQKYFNCEELEYPIK